MSKQSGHKGVVLLMFVLLAATQVEGQLQSWSMANFSSNIVSQLELLGDVVTSNATGPSVLSFDLNGASTGVATAGRALYHNAVQFKDETTGSFASFNTSFTFAINNVGVGAGCTGFTFQIKGDNTSLGDAGKFLGLTSLANDGANGNDVFAVEFDTFQDVDLKDPSASHIGVDINSVRSFATYDLCPNVTSCTNLTNNGLFLAQISFDGAAQSLSVQLLNASTSRMIADWTVPSLPIQPIFNKYMYVGFSASNGVDCNETHNIYAWNFATFRSSYALSPGYGALPQPHTTYDCYDPRGCKSGTALKIGLIAGIGGGALIFLLAILYMCCCRRKQSNKKEYSSGVPEPKSGPPSAKGVDAIKDPAVKVDMEAGQPQKAPLETEAGESALYKVKGKEVADLNSSAVAAPMPITKTVVMEAAAVKKPGPSQGTENAKPSAPAASVYEPRTAPPVAEPMNRNADGKVTMCCVQTRPKRDYKEPVAFSYKELAIATKNFSVKELIGGTPTKKPVYKGFLRDTGAAVAIKELALDDLSNEFLSKAMLLGRIRHPNLVHLVGWCKEKDKLFMVYDYMPKGSLDKSLLLDSNTEGFLNFDARHNVLVGVAAALTYLHEEWERCVVHRDLKPSNVLLDATSNAHLGNFSHASLVDHNKAAESTVLDGTLGYMAPEIPFTGKPTAKSDVFSFGVLALEIACGRLPLDWQLPHDDRVLLDCVWRAYEEKELARVVDKRLDPASFSMKQMTTLLQLGLYCCHSDPRMRPNMAFVWQILIGRATVPALPPHKPVVENYASLYPDVRHPIPLSISNC